MRYLVLPSLLVLSILEIACGDSASNANSNKGYVNANISYANAANTSTNAANIAVVTQNTPRWTRTKTSSPNNTANTAPLPSPAPNDTLPVPTRSGAEKKDEGLFSFPPPRATDFYEIDRSA
jgi:hypothetical protein